MSQVAGARAPDPAYGSLYRLGGVAALIVAFLIAAEIVALGFFPQPSTISGWFILFQANPIIGLLDFWGLEVPMYAMFAMVFLALYVVLEKVNIRGMAIAFTLAPWGLRYSSQPTTPSRCSPSAVSLLLRRQTRRGPRSWQQGRRFLPIRTNQPLVASTWAFSWSPLRA